MNIEIESNVNAIAAAFVAIMGKESLTADQLAAVEISRDAAANLANACDFVQMDSQAVIFMSYIKTCNAFKSVIVGAADGLAVDGVEFSYQRLVFRAVNIQMKH